MKKYLLDTNHLSPYLDRDPSLENKIDAALRAGNRFGVCLPVLCEYRGGIRVSNRYRQNLSRLETALRVFRDWPNDDSTAEEYAEIYRELRIAGKAMSHFDLLIAATARQYSLTLLTADQDFAPVIGIAIENWL